MILGVDMFANTGFRLSVRAFLDGTPYTTSRDVYLMLGGLIALFIAGSLIQYKFHRNHHFGPSHPKGYDKSVESGNGSDHAPVTEKKKENNLDLLGVIFKPKLGEDEIFIKELKQIGRITPPSPTKFFADCWMTPATKKYRF
ncbi:6612_t:CDS:2 [Entrophospora sp. SA101]|nr:6612_t:CDS:2 [Entrophospora sp. SA101]